MSDERTLASALREMAKMYEADISFNWPDGHHELSKIIPREYPYVGTVKNWITILEGAANLIDAKGAKL